MNTNIIINNEVFVNKLKHIKLSDIPDVYLKKSAEIQKYSCFNSIYNSKLIWDKKKKNDKEIVNKNKIHIIINDFSDKSKNKREFISYLNKLTDNKKFEIYKKIQNIILHNDDNNELFNLLYNFIIKSDVKNIKIYLTIFNFLNKEIVINSIELYWNNFINNKEWIPPSYILENNLMCGNEDDEMYNLYCDYVKWKKINSAKINILLSLVTEPTKINDLLLNIYNYLLEYISNSKNLYRHIIDILLEDIIILLSYYNNEEIINNFKNMDLTIFENSSKFIIYNIIGKK
jgi:hypothetical protein